MGWLVTRILSVFKCGEKCVCERGTSGKSTSDLMDSVVTYVDQFLSSQFVRVEKKDFRDIEKCPTSCKVQQATPIFDLIEYVECFRIESTRQVQHPAKRQEAILLVRVKNICTFQQTNGSGEAR